MRFEEPLWLWLILLLPLIAHAMRKHRFAGIRYSALAIIPPFAESFRARLGRIVPGALRLLALLLIILALARPVAVWSERNDTVEGIDIVLVTDVSSSMTAKDLGRRTRLEYSIEILKDFISRRPNDRIGLVVFSGRAYTQAPMTIDHDILGRLIDSIRPGLIEDGTAIGMALGTAVHRLRTSKAKSKIVILLTDGENNAGVIDPITAAEIARTFGVKVYTVGIGSKEGYRFTVRDPNTGQLMTGFYSFNEDLLKRIAAITDGRYFNATNARQLREIYNQIDQLERTEMEVIRSERTREIFGSFGIAALLILALEIALSETRLQKVAGMRFANPENFVFLLLAPMLLAFLLWSAGWKRRRGAAFVDEALQARLTPSISRNRIRWKRALIFFGATLLTLGAARPQFGTRVRYVEQRGIDIVAAIDTSESMAADDFRPTRFKAATLAVRRIVRKLTGDRIGLVCFSGDAFIQSPLTSDYDGFLVLMDAVEVGNIPRPGTNLAAAIEKALAALEQGGGGGKQRAIVLFTDGESHEGDLDAVIESAREKNCVIYAIGYGTEAGSPIRVGGSFKKDRQGNLVITRLDAATLNKLAEGTGGRYFQATQGGREIDEFFVELEKFEKGEAVTERVEAGADRFQYFLAGAFILLGLEAALGCTEAEGMKRIAIVLLCIIAITVAGATSLLEEGNAHFRRGEYLEALRRYENVPEESRDRGRALFNAGVARFMLGDHDTAAALFAAASGHDSSLVGASNYNRGNALFLKERFQEAAEAYKAALRFDPTDSAAKHNLLLALARMKKDDRNDTAGSNQPQPDGGNSGANAPQPQPQGGMDREMAERILQGLADADAQTRRDLSRRPVAVEAGVEKDW